MKRFLLAMATALILAPSAFAGRHYIGGVVEDRNGDPVDRVIISLTPGNVELVSDREGRFVIDYLRDESGERTKLAKKTDYQVEIFKPGFHVQTHNFYFKSRGLELKPFTLIEETIQIRDEGENLDPALYSDPSTNVGATYEGQ
ncbi:MAG: carboxypeptidase regulatory-like domain-containing protein [Deltaproteobacteria bacterium]|nr:carboxypeptidase regulatory-like domain-containing protein [Deltaproteobacteria bacterium]